MRERTYAFSEDRQRSTFCGDVDKFLLNCQLATPKPVSVVQVLGYFAIESLNNSDDEGPFKADGFPNIFIRPE